MPDTTDALTNLYKFLLPEDPRPHGFMLPETVAKMPWTPGFNIDHDAKSVSFAAKAGCTACLLFKFNNALQKTVDAAIEQNLFSILNGRHSEHYRIIGTQHPVTLERFASPLFGIASRGAHMTGFTRMATGEIKVWIPRRAKHLFTYPNMLDTTVAGGVKADHTPFECIVEEAHEEASLPADFVRTNAKSVGVLTYMNDVRKTGLVRPDVLYVFDLEMPTDMVPRPNDEEVADFTLMSVEEIQRAMAGGDFKPNCNLVMIDFFVRYGILTAESEPDFVDIVSRLHRKLLVPTSPRME